MTDKKIGQQVTLSRIAESPTKQKPQMN